MVLAILYVLKYMTGEGSLSASEITQWLGLSEYKNKTGSTNIDSRDSATLTILGQ